LPRGLLPCALLQHRNTMNEFMGLIRGMYEAKQGGFLPGGAVTLQQQLSVLLLRNVRHCAGVSTLPHFFTFTSTSTSTGFVGM
jgi:hypothetical protein